MSKRYKNRLAVTGEKTGKRVHWLTFPGGRAKDDPSIKLHHMVAVYKITDNGLEYVCWTGQLGICFVKGKLRHVIPGNVVVDKDPSRIVIVSMHSPFGKEDETAQAHLDAMRASTSTTTFWSPFR